uniref:Uncharacterized protein n=1 Tax=Kalanchoe fedtschenkoi TaxID=63787 RepID=A0A7N0RFR3_KALFE
MINMAGDCLSSALSLSFLFLFNVSSVHLASNPLVPLLQLRNRSTTLHRRGWRHQPESSNLREINLNVPNDENQTATNHMTAFDLINSDSKSSYNDHK